MGTRCELCRTPNCEHTRPLDWRAIRPANKGENETMTDKERIEKLRNAFRVTLMMACQDDEEAIEQLFPESEILKVEAYFSSLEDCSTLGEYFKEILAL
jgi:hypothetical protein